MPHQGIRSVSREEAEPSPLQVRNRCQGPGHLSLETPGVKTKVPSWPLNSVWPHLPWSRPTRAPSHFRGQGARIPGEASRAGLDPPWKHLRGAEDLSWETCIRPPSGPQLSRERAAAPGRVGQTRRGARSEVLRPQPHRFRLQGSIRAMQGSLWLERKWVGA